MKKVLSITIMLMVAIAVNAQGEWKMFESKSDELKGQKGGPFYVYAEEGMGAFVSWGFDNYSFRIVADKSQFDIMIGNNAITKLDVCVPVIVGIYDNDNNLKEKIYMYLIREGNRANQFAMASDDVSGHKKNIKKVFNVLQSGDGYIRILASRLNADDFDLKIPPFNISQ